MFDGADVQELAPTQSSYIEIFNGQRRTRKTVTLGYSITPTVQGTMTIPAFPINVDGKEYVVGPYSVTVKVAGPAALLEVIAAKESVYVGEAVPLTLRLLIKPYRDARSNYTTNESFMWSLVDHQHSDWGGFESYLRELANRDQTVRGKPVVRCWMRQRMKRITRMNFGIRSGPGARRIWVWARSIFTCTTL